MSFHNEILRLLPPIGDGAGLPCSLDDQVPEFVYYSEITLTKETRGGNHELETQNVLQNYWMFSTTPPSTHTPGDRKYLKVFPLANGRFEGLMPNAILWP